MLEYVGPPCSQTPTQTVCELLIPHPGNCPLTHNNILKSDRNLRSNTFNCHKNQFYR